MLLSEAQYKLAALLTKTKDLLPFATDAACDEMFASLADFARDMLVENDRRKEKNFDDMKLEDLLRLTTPLGRVWRRAFFFSSFFYLVAL